MVSDPLQISPFYFFLEEMDTAYGDVLLDSEIR
jgi:hypothetical protein